MQETAMKVSKMESSWLEKNYHLKDVKTDIAFVGDQLQDKFRRWLSPPDPWTNHNIAREAHHHGTATWFTEGDMFGQWKSTGSFLWVNGLRARLSFPFFSATYSSKCRSRFWKNYHFVCIMTTIFYSSYSYQ
jgi:hypothetical protein